MSNSMGMGFCGEQGVADDRALIELVRATNQTAACPDGRPLLVLAGVMAKVINRAVRADALIMKLMQQCSDGALLKDIAIYMDATRK